MENQSEAREDTILNVVRQVQYPLSGGRGNIATRQSISVGTTLVIQTGDPKDP
jgi:hypothetical protein